MRVSPSRLLAPVAFLALALLGACKSDLSVAPSTIVDTIPTPSAPLSLGDVVTVNVNGQDACTNPIYHGARVVAIGTYALILNDTLNPSGFTTADFQRVAARFDTLVYPLDVDNFGAPTDIDKNGHIAILFTRAVNELTPARSTQYTGGFAFSRDLFPKVGTARASACAASNQGEYFYLLTPDPAGTINGNVRTTGFVDSVSTAVLAHEFQHLINASRRLYINSAGAFEEKWLDEGLAHIAEELLFYRSSGLTPRLNIDINRVRATSTAKNAYNLAMASNGGRYRTYLQAPATSSPYAADDSLTTRGAVWSLLRYSVDRLNATDGFTAGDGQIVAGSGTAPLAAGSTSAEYSITVANTTLQSGGSLSYTLNTSALGASMLAATTATPISPALVPTASVTPVSASVNPNALRSDEQFESRLRSRERVELTPLMGTARAWYAAQGRPAASAMRSVSSLSAASSFADADAALWYRLVNTTTTGFGNLQRVVPDLGGFVRDWQVSHAVDDVASLSTQYQQRSWNWHSIYPAVSAGYPLHVQTISTSAAITGSVVAGGASFYKLVVPANGTVTLTLGAGSGAASPNLQLVIVRTK
jgi:hypothetical protein